MIDRMKIAVSIALTGLILIAAIAILLTNHHTAAPVTPSGSIGTAQVITQAPAPSSGIGTALTITSEQAA